MLALAALAAIALALTSAFSASAQDDPAAAPAATPTPTPEPVVRVRTERRMPKKVIRKRRKFTVPAYPSASYVLNVIALHEAQRWGASYLRLRCRIAGESGGSVWATNGQYEGIGQFADETFGRGMSSIGSRKVKLVAVRHRMKRPVYIDHFSDGTTERRRGAKRRQRVVITKVGWIPRWPAKRHAWAQTRIMARAFVGLGAVNDSEWEVRC
jgi:hypothetical protein